MAEFRHRTTADERLRPPSSCDSQARTASLPATQHSNAWGTTYQLNTPAPTSLSTTNPTASGVAWPNAQVHQLVHNGVSTPHVASPPWPISAPNPSYYPYPSTAPGSTGRY
ncbi:MAG: hypothetical protein MUF23_10255 [Pirellula sp.]|nr:hypothetical protein [Pirellula sp.]